LARGPRGGATSAPASRSPGAKTRLGRARPLVTLSVLWLLLAAAGCPANESDVRISPAGIAWLSTACRPCAPTPPFPPSRPDDGRFPPTFPGFGSDCACALPNHYAPALGRSVTEARLFLVTPGDGRIQDASKCMTLHLCPESGRSGLSSSCMASDLNQQLDGAMPNGLGFDGLKNPEDAQLILAFYQPQESNAEASCHRADLFACAGLAAPLGGGDYDITCASCQGGAKAAPGPDNGPCPRDQAQRNSCFLQWCDSLLDQNQYQ